MNVISENLGLLGSGLLTTLLLALAGYAGALVVGTLVAVCRVSPVPPLRWEGANWSSGRGRIGERVRTRGAAVR